MTGVNDWACPSCYSSRHLPEAHLTEDGESFSSLEFKEHILAMSDLVQRRL